MLISYLLLICGAFPAIDLEPDIIIDEDIPTDTSHFLTYPFDAVRVGTRTFVAPGEHFVLVYERGEYHRVIGREGEGPGEFVHPPASLQIEDNALIVTELYGWRRSHFTLEGELVGTEDLDKQHFALAGTRLKKQRPSDAVAKGYLYENRDAGCSFGKLQGDLDTDYHLAQSALLSYADRIVVVYARGALEVFDTDCRRVAEREIQLDRFKRDIERDTVLTQLEHGIGNNLGFYKNGLPINAETIEPNGTVWLLVSNEHMESAHERKPGETWLYRVPIEGEIRFGKLPVPAGNIHFSNGSLAIIYREEAAIHIHEAAALTDALEPHLP